MLTAIEYALLAGASYYDNRPAINRFLLPQNWSYVSRIPPKSSGFEAASFTNGSEVVISFAGTDFSPRRSDERFHRVIRQIELMSDNAYGSSDLQMHQAMSSDFC